ncbi:hypothetical protein SODG_003850 [Sodalis praecaptivus]
MKAYWLLLTVLLLTGCSGMGGSCSIYPTPAMFVPMAAMCSLINVMIKGRYACFGLSRKP